MTRQDKKSKWHQIQIIKQTILPKIHPRDKLDKLCWRYASQDVLQMPGSSFPINSVQNQRFPNFPKSSQTQSCRLPYLSKSGFLKAPLISAKKGYRNGQPFSRTNNDTGFRSERDSSFVLPVFGMLLFQISPLDWLHNNFSLLLSLLSQSQKSFEPRLRKASNILSGFKFEIDFFPSRGEHVTFNILSHPLA